MTVDAKLKQKMTTTGVVTEKNPMWIDEPCTDSGRSATVPVSPSIPPPHPLAARSRLRRKMPGVTICGVGRDRLWSRVRTTDFSLS